MRKKLLLSGLFLLFCFLQTIAQQRTVTGTVTSSEGVPLEGASVIVIGEKTGVRSDASGSFSITVPANAKELEISYISSETQMVDISNTSNVSVKLVPRTGSLNEVVVTGYGTAKRKDVTGAVASISEKNFNEGNITSPMQQIQGKVSGLVITQSGGDPNDNPIIRLRGQTSLSGGQTPLIVVDGVPLDDPNQLSNIPPGDIASFDVLKDASATAVYGSRGANGVIIVNTKKGATGKTQVTYNGFISASKIADKYDLLTTSEYKALPDADDRGGNTDWTDAITQSAITHSHTLAVSGGSGGFSYRGSANYINQEGIVINTGKEEVGLRFNAQQKAINNRLDLQVGIVSTRTNRDYVDGNIFTSILATPPTFPIYNDDGSYYGYSIFSALNPVAQQLEQVNTGVESFNQYYGTANFELVKGLKVGTTGSLSFFDKQTDFYQPSLPGSGNVNNGSKFTENRNSKHGDIHIDYLHDFDNHNLSVTGVYEYNLYSYDNYNSGAQDFLLDLNTNNSIGNGNSAKNVVGSYKEEFKIISFLGMLNYNYNSKYYAKVTFRRDGSSKFGINNRWGNFPSVSVGWRLTQENFLKNTTWLNELKINAGYGVTGNQDAISPYNTLLTLGSVGRYYNPATPNFAYRQAYAPNQNANPDLKWEERHGVNIGLDFGVFNNRLSGNLNWFKDKTKNLLYDYTVPVPPFYVNTILANVGSMENKGFEIQLNAAIVRGKNFTWDGSGQLTFIKTQVTSLSGSYAGNPLSTDNIPGGYAQGRGASSSPLSYLKVGYSPYTFFLPHYAGVDADGNQLFADKKGGTVTSGDLTDEMFSYIDPAPKLNYGFNTTVTLKQWSLNVFLRGVSGQKIFNNTGMIVSNPTRLPGNNILKEGLSNGIKDAAVASDLWLQDASYLRLDNATLSYNFNKVGFMQNLRVYITGNNLFVITKYKGLDPEIRPGDTNQAYIDASYGGTVGYYYYPRSRSITLGVNVAFK
jgi:TonB-linked SusC/RagA family outer membrane protein